MSGQERGHHSEEQGVPRERTDDSVSATPDEQPTTTYEQAREELADVVRRLEAGGLTLEESLALWERGEALATRCEQWLSGARARVEAAQRPDG